MAPFSESHCTQWPLSHVHSSPAWGQQKKVHPPRHFSCFVGLFYFFKVELERSGCSAWVLTQGRYAWVTPSSSDVRAHQIWRVPDGRIEKKMGWGWERKVCLEDSGQSLPASRARQQDAMIRSLIRCLEDTAERTRANDKLIGRRAANKPPSLTDVCLEEFYLCQVCTIDLFLVDNKQTK